MMASKRAHLTPEQIELAEQRKLKKQKQLEVQAPSTPPKAPILLREWAPLLLHQSPRKDEAAFPVKIMTFNEVDRLEKLLPVLNEAGYSHTFVAGPGKKHGCLIAYAKDKYTKVGDKVVYYDEQEVRHDIDDEKARVGCSFKTRNIGSLVALKHLKGDGVIIATTHLFWHPSYHYERTRQVGILVRETLKFQREYDLREWPCFIAGDFNFAPGDPAYPLLVGDALTQDQERCLNSSRVVHVSIDPTVSTVKNTETEAEGGETDPDKIITKARPARPADGLLSTPELVELFSTGAHLRSAYDEGQKALRESGVEIETFGDRCSLPPSKLGAHEPMWTCYTHYWKTVLDYIFVLEPARSRVVLTGYTKPHRTEDIRLGLPQVGICGSDHFSVCAEFHVIPEEPRPT
ncbi:hypothetical protein SERLA73DRAFT_87448 [Serpula lacrymans var. lacrymans S7.3]|uniref:Endonuclease/exonuclease/phosphatase domain-containing protein n=1 Tax=Serpula lacrymans var. lacrymans (strain S7.3) TaxID=936435 RepID=F8PTQ5_SERL3|nr:hypothetical protein SERLA73DRAFT_87448 [Serpula lacrymans var. lacrymans S7.3]